MANVLVVAPHPDDEVLGCGGTIARHAKAGDRVRVAIVTRGIPELCTKSDNVEIVRKELSAAHHLLGVEQVGYLDFPAAKLNVVPAYEIAAAIKNVIDAFQPTIVYAPHWGDVHLDHKITYLSTLVACRPCNQHQVLRLLCYETLSETEWGTPAAADAFMPTVYTEITDYLSVKLEAFACYRSQLRVAPHPRSVDGIRSLAQLRGAHVCLPAAEAFVLVRELNVACDPCGKAV
jgi:LmbE family N-acetylglucosaminyl deacetylase